MPRYFSAAYNSSNNTKDYFSWGPKKINVSFHKNCENTGKSLKISCVRCHFVKFDIYFLTLSKKFSLVLSIALEKCKNECDIV